MAGNRRRDLERHRARQRAAAEAERQRKRRLAMALAAAALAAVVAIFVLVSVVGGDDDDSESAAPSTDFTYGDEACPPEQKPEETPRSFDDAPQRCIEEGVDYRALVQTSEGDITIDLLEDRAPGTVNNFVVLARWGWFDGDDFHRVVPGFVIQAGDPFGEPQGTGGPGYSIPDELPEAVTEYRPGAVAMANSGPDSGGSQWFICIDCSGLPGPDYALFGQVTEGFDVVEAINALGTSDGPPPRPVTIESVEIQEA